MRHKIFITKHQKQLPLKGFVLFSDVNYHN